MENITICECHLLPLMGLAFLAVSLAECLAESAAEKQWRRKALKFLSNEDIELIRYYFDTYYSESNIGKVIVNAYKKEEDLKKFRKQRWERFKNFFRFKK